MRQRESAKQSMSWTADGQHHDQDTVMVVMELSLGNALIQGLI